MTSVKIDAGSLFIMESCDVLQPRPALWAVARAHEKSEVALPSSWRTWCWSGDQRSTSGLGGARGFLLGNYPEAREWEEDGGLGREHEGRWHLVGSSSSASLHPLHPEHTHAHARSSQRAHTQHLGKTWKLITEQRPAIITKWLSV